MSGGLEQIREGLTPTSMGRVSGQYLPGAGRRGRSPAGRWPQYPCGGAAGARPAFKTIWGSDMTRRRGAGRSCMGAG